MIGLVLINIHARPFPLSPFGITSLTDRIGKFPTSFLQLQLVLKASKLHRVHSSLLTRPQTLVANTVSAAQRSVCALQKVWRLHISDHCLSSAASVKSGRQPVNLIFMTQFRSQNQPLPTSREGSFWSRLRHLFENTVIGIKSVFSCCSSLCKTLQFYSNLFKRDHPHIHIFLVFFSLSAAVIAVIRPHCFCFFYLISVFRE